MDRETSLEKLDVLICKIVSAHSSQSEEWINYCIANNIKLFNQKKEKVIHIQRKPEIMDSIRTYVEYLNGQGIVNAFEYMQDDFTVTSRVKNVNSINEKFEEYCNYRDEGGEVQINKCFNDLLGIRAIIDCAELDYDDIVERFGDRGFVIEEKNERHRLLGHSYRATHIYFKYENDEYKNIAFRWELQIWKSQDEITNQESHKNHRYRYKEWESELSSE